MILVTRKAVPETKQNKFPIVGRRGEQIDSSTGTLTPDLTTISSLTTGQSLN